MKKFFMMLIVILATACAFGQGLDRINEDLHEDRKTALTLAAEKAGASVVNIGAERVGYIRRNLPGRRAFPFFFDPFPLYQRARQKTPFLGSGIVLDKKGHIVTNFHVVTGAQKVFVTLACGTEYEAEVVDTDPISDLAILKIDSDRLVPATLGDSDGVRLAEWVLAIGNPYGALLGDPCPTITAGVISATGRFFKTNGSNPRLYENMLQTDAAINPGNSGGALVNARGEVIGVNTFIFSDSGGSIGLGFAIPINRVKQKLEEIEKYGHLREAQLDFGVTDITRYYYQALNLSVSQGALVVKVARGGPAEKAGLEPGDVIVSVNGRGVENRRAFLVYAFSRSVGDTLQLEVARQDKRIKMDYILPAREE